MATKQQLLDQRYMRMARIWAENSYCKRRQVGALLVKNQMIISDSFWLRKQLRRRQQHFSPIRTPRRSQCYHQSGSFRQ